jgi:2-polyprenyl-3-methyl-5-hydroxy-6-metoxy-1,4-benzoquinol methylase
MEVKVYNGTFPFTSGWYAERAHANHLEQEEHWGRMSTAAELAHEAVALYELRSIVDLGSGDGGMLALLADLKVPSWGYDLCPPNVAFAQTARHVRVRYADFLRDKIEWGDLAVCTEVLEHLEDPHGFVRRIAQHSRALVASSPSCESAAVHDPCHAWVWDMAGYRAMIEGAGFSVAKHVEVAGGYSFQVLLAAQ